MFRRIRIALLALSLIGGLLAVTSVPIGAANSESSFQGEDFPIDLRWSSCFEEVAPIFECATARVPLDYDRLDGGRIAVETIRIPASGERIGSIFLNPGGPGGSGIDFLLGAGPFIFSPAITENYDIVSFDPRGIGSSSPLLCFGTLNAAFAAASPIAFPTNPAEEDLFRRSGGFLQTQCENRGGIIQNKMSTANVARDLDVLRAAVGDEQLNYYGLSYGSILGQTYAALFPDNVGRIAIDGVLSLDDWVGDPDGRSDQTLNQRLRSDIGAEATFDEFVRLCEEAGPAGCALAPNAEARVDAIVAAIQESPIPIIDPETGEIVFAVTESDFTSTTLSILFDPFGYSFLAELLAELEPGIALLAPPLDNEGPSLEAVVGAFSSSQSTPTSFQRNPPYFNFVEGFPGVACVDTAPPNVFRAWPAAAEQVSAESPVFGEIWTWVDSVCNQWPGRDTDRFAGPTGQATANPLLVLSTRFDPSTPLEGAQRAHAALPGSSLVTVEGVGHTTLFTSSCAGAILEDFFLTGNLAPNGTSCPQDLVDPFAPFGPPGFQAGARAALMAQAWSPR